MFCNIEKYLNDSIYKMIKIIKNEYIWSLNVFLNLFTSVSSRNQKGKCHIERHLNYKRTNKNAYLWSLNVNLNQSWHMNDNNNSKIFGCLKALSSKCITIQKIHLELSLFCE